MRFTVAAWAITRSIILAAFALAAPHGIVAALGNWDGAWYKAVVLHGYEFVPDGKAHDVAFFPLFPLVAGAVMHAGVAWPLAGVVVNNLAFLGALFVMYGFARNAYDVETARWSVVVACALPLSLFGAVAYSEGLFMLASAGALLAYQRGHYLVAGLLAACASATRPLGVALAFGLIAAALVERKRRGAALQCAIGLLGVAGFALYCQLRFSDPLAFVHAQIAWRHHAGFDVAAWFAVLQTAVRGSVHSWMQIVLLLVAVACIVVFGKRIGAPGVAYVAFVLVAIALAGTPFSIDRFLYATVPLLVALGRLCARAPFLGYAVTALLLPLLFIDATTFAQFHWVA